MTLTLASLTSRTMNTVAPINTWVLQAAVVKTSWIKTATTHLKSLPAFFNAFGLHAGVEDNQNLGKLFIPNNY